MQDAQETGLRLRAARALAGYDSRKDFSAFLAMPGFGDGTIRATEQGERELRPQEIALVAEKCGLPREFFTAPREGLGAPAPVNHNGEVVDRLARIEGALLEVLTPSGVGTLTEAVQQLASAGSTAERPSSRPDRPDQEPGRRSPRRQAS